MPSTSRVSASSAIIPERERRVPRLPLPQKVRIVIAIPILHALVDTNTYNVLQRCSFRAMNSLTKEQWTPRCLCETILPRSSRSSDLILPHLLLLLLFFFFFSSPLPPQLSLPFKHAELRESHSPKFENLKVENSGSVPSLSTKMAPPRSLFLTAVVAVALLLFSAAPLRAGASAFPEALDAGEAYFSDEALAHLSESLTKCERKGERETAFFLLCFSLGVFLASSPPTFAHFLWGGKTQPRPSKKIKKTKN